MEAKITASDFRINNWVKPGFEDDSPCRITAIKHDCDGYKGYFAEYKGGSSSIEDDEGDYFFEPIPLTEEILLKAGFEKEGDYYKIGYHKFVSPNSSAYTKLEVQPQYHRYFAVYMVDELLVMIEYVHQLQNLYWCLCGEELNITL